MSLLMTWRIRQVPPSGAKVSPVRRTRWIWAAVATVKASTRRLGRLTDTRPPCGGSSMISAHRVLDAREVGRRQRGEGHLVVAGPGQAVATIWRDLVGRPLAHRAGDHARPGRTGSPGCSPGRPRR